MRAQGIRGCIFLLVPAALLVATQGTASAQLAPTPPPAVAPGPAAVHLDLGQQAAKRGDAAMADRELKAAVAAAPQDAAIALAVGVAYYGMSRPDDAIKAWNQGLSGARTPDLLYNLGVAYRAK